MNGLELWSEVEWQYGEKLGGKDEVKMVQDDLDSREEADLKANLRRQCCKEDERQPKHLRCASGIRSLCNLPDLLASSPSE